jgi:3-dehydroquinate synthase
MNLPINISVHAERDYLVHGTEDWRRELARIIDQGRTLIIAPAKLSHSWGLSGFISPSVHLYETPDGEEQKVFPQLEALWNACADVRLGRSDRIVAIGGGATTDLGGFVAATWLRGISWIAIPTTLAGMVDAAIGGKTAINSPSGKNLIGAFHSPSEVVIDYSFLQSLSSRDINAGLAEVIKVGLIKDNEILALLERTSTDLLIEALPELIERSIRVKAEIVSQDFTESRLREVLNFGHTLGHAIERYENYSQKHGEAVAVGILFALELSAIVENLPRHIIERAEGILSKYNLPTRYPASARDLLLESLRFDKKTRGAHLRFIGLRSIQEPVWIEDPSPATLKTAYERIAL